MYMTKIENDGDEFGFFNIVVDLHNNSKLGFTYDKDSNSAIFAICHGTNAARVNWSLDQHYNRAIDDIDLIMHYLGKLKAEIRSGNSD